MAKEKKTIDYRVEKDSIGTKDVPEAHLAMWYGMSKTLINAQWSCWEENSPPKKMRIKIAKKIDKFA